MNWCFTPSQHSQTDKAKTIYIHISKQYSAKQNSKQTHQNTCNPVCSAKQNSKQTHQNTCNPVHDETALTSTKAEVEANVSVQKEKKSHYSLKLNNIYLLNPSFTLPPPPEFPMPLFQLQPLRRIYNFTCQTSASYIFTSSPWQRSSPAASDHRSQTPANCFITLQHSYTQPSHHNPSMHKSVC